MVADIGKDFITDQFIQSLCTRLGENKRVRRKLPGWGRVHIDRQLPFLCVYRKPPDRDDAGTEKLLFGEAAYLVASGAAHLHKGLCSLVKGIVESQAETFGRVLVIEIWSGRIDESASSRTKPGFLIHAPSGSEMQAVVDRLRDSLKSIRVHKQRAEVEVTNADISPRNGLRALAQKGDLKKLGATWIGLEIKPVYRDSKGQGVYPLILRTLHRSISRSFKLTFFEFAKSHTRHKVPHFMAMGRKAVVKAVWDIDNRLADISNSFSLLLTITPTNAEAAYSAFRRSRYEKTPQFTYHPIPVDTSLLKRTLYAIPLERVEDPVLAHIFREQQDDLDRRLTMLSDRNTSRFLYGSMQIFGGVKNWIFELAVNLLNTISPRTRNGTSGGYVTAEEFVKYAKEEIAHYRDSYPGFSGSSQVRKDVSGLIVSKGVLLVGAQLKVPLARVKALLQHEVGTHLLTYFNGKAQPFKQLYVGLAGYDELQEGIATLSEYLVGGLSRTRMRLLAGRVVAVRRLIEGATFLETFRELSSGHGFEKRTAFMITMRVFRGGGMTKDATYLKGLVRLLKYLGDGGDLEVLFLGKFNTDHIPLIRELTYRNILHPAPALPRYLVQPEAQERLTKLRNKMSLFDLIERDRERKTRR